MTDSRLNTQERKEYSSSFHTFAAVWGILWEHATPEHPLSAQDIWSQLKLSNQTPDRLPSPSTIGKLLRNSCSSTSCSFLFQLRCVTRVGEELIPYEQWEEQLEQKALPNGAHPSRSNRPRLYYLEKPLSPGEWRVFSDLIRSSPRLTGDQAGKLLKAIRHFDPSQQKLPCHGRENRGPQNFLAVLNRLDQAICQHRCISLTYGSWQLEQDGNRWQPRLHPLPSGITGCLQPYTLFWAGGHYYLAAADNSRVLYLRTDRICMVKLLEDTFTLPPNFDPAALTAGDCLCSGAPVSVRLRCSLSLLGTVLDHFGNRPVYNAPKDGNVEFTLWAVPETVKRFVLQHCDSAEILQPAELRLEVRDILHRAARQHQ